MQVSIFKHSKKITKKVTYPLFFLIYCFYIITKYFILSFYIYTYKSLKYILESLTIVDFRTTNRKVKLRKIKIPIKNLPITAIGVKILLISDLHYSFKINHKLITRLIKDVNKINPDVILIAGDFVCDDFNEVENLANVLKNLKCKSQIYGVFGNHDILPAVKEALLTSLEGISKIKMLENEVVWPLGKKLAFVGMGELKSQDFKPELAFQNLSRDIPRIVISHQPITALELQKYRADLILCGHLHGGAVRIPFYGSIFPHMQKITEYIPEIVFQFIRGYIPAAKNLKSVAHGEWCEGLHRFKRAGKNGENLLYVSRGVGSGPKSLRIFNPPEINLIELIPK